jgi:hypothetical protein
MYTAAVGVYEGKIPNRDFFAQYGPISPVIQGLWFQMTNPSVWSLKLLSSFGLALIGTFIYIGVKKRLSIPTSMLLSICWVLTGPFGLPWSSIFSTTFILGSLLLLESTLSSRSPKKCVYFSFAIGFILAVGTFTRIHTILVFFAFSLGLLLLNRNREYFRITTWLNLGFFLTFGVITLILAICDALPSLINQCLIWASGNYGHAPKPSVGFFANLAWIPLFGTMNLLILRQIIASKSMKGVRFLVLSTFFCYSTFVVLSQLSHPGIHTLKNLRVLEIIGGQKAQFSFNFTVIIFFLVVIYIFLLKPAMNLGFLKFITTQAQFTYVLIALAASTQLYPFPDEYHIAFVVPVIIVSCIFVIPKNLKLAPQQVAFNYLALALIPALIAHFLLLAKVERYEFQSKSLTGMYGSWQTAKSLDVTMSQLEPEPSGIRFECADGIYAGSGGRYLSVDEKFVTWGPKAQERKTFDRLFLCYVDQKILDSYLKRGWDIKFKVLWRPITGYTETSYWNVLLEKSELSLSRGGLG